MDPSQLKYIKSIIHIFEKHVPIGKHFLEDIDTMDTKQLLSALNKVFAEEEKAILKENSKSYRTDTYENNVRHFATQLIMSMVSNHNELKGYEEYRSLLNQRHVAYGYYHSLEEGDHHGNELIEELLMEYMLYSGLVKFYNNFYGSFSDNQEAIKLLCKYYPKFNSLFEDKTDIVDAIFSHVTNAGTPSDRGYAYRGIELIRENIGYLSMDIIDELLQKYELYRIVNEKVYRHQVFTIINNADMTNEEDRRKYKFSYLDSLLLANSMNRSLYEKFGDQEHLNRHYLSLGGNLTVDKIGVIINENVEGSTYAYWTNGCSLNRQFIVDKEIKIIMCLQLVEKRISIIYMNDPSTEISFNFNYADWILDEFQLKETEQKLHNFILKQRITYNHLTFSLLYLSCYRGLKEQLVDFDHKFTYDVNTNELKPVSKSPGISHFYGRRIHSMSCIVGKNGTGKTSTVDFLRNTFFKLLYLIAENKIACNNGCISESDYKAYNVVDIGSKFFIVFYLGKEPYYLTNMNVTTTVAKPFESDTYKSVHELSKVVYFSTMLSVNQDSLLLNEENTSRVISDENKLAQSLIGFRQADYSEASSFSQKRRAMETSRMGNDTPIINVELCYQLAFLDYISPDKLAEYLDMLPDQAFTLTSRLSGQNALILRPGEIGREFETLRPFIMAPDAKLDYFSSGQYAKFSFLAKLYWFLEGQREYAVRFETLTEVSIFSGDDALQAGEKALLFIDEGELYYHPEWQRKYIEMLLEFIHNIALDTSIQVVITTNSPFIISDILSEDITYLSDGEKEFDQTFGQNIHKLLTQNFFMSYTIGEYSRKLITNIANWINSKGDDSNNEIGKGLSQYYKEPINPNDYYGEIRKLIYKIGEQIYREKLLDTLRKSEVGRVSELEALLRQRDDIDDKIKLLKEGE